MTYRITNVRLAHALSIIGESAPEAFEYDSAVSAYSGEIFTSRKMRLTPAPTPRFTAKEFRFFLMFAFREEYVVKINDGGADIKNGFLSTDTDHLELSLKGWRFIETYDQPILSRWIRQILNNVPTIIISVLASLAVGWAAYNWGAPN